MVKVDLGQLRDQESHYGLYKQPSPTGDLIVVRRKVASPLDYMHSSSQKVKRQRENFALASRHYAGLTRLQRRRLKNELAEVEYVMRYASPHIKVLGGRQLFLSQDIHQLNTKQELLKVPGDFCIRLVDENFDPLEGDIILRYKVDGVFIEAIKTQVSATDYCFSAVPPDCAPYIPTATAVGYTDPGDVMLSFNRLKTYHYHQLSVPDELEQWLQQFYSWSVSMSCRWWSNSVRVTSFQPFVQLAARVEIWSYFYSGNLWIGTKEYTPRLPPPEWHSKSDYPL